MDGGFPTWKTSTYRRKTGFSKGGGTEVYVSPVSPKKPLVFDHKLLDIDNDLGEREEDFLRELREFYNGVTRYDEVRMEMERSKQRLAKKSLDLLQLASELSAYQQMLEQRADQAQNVMSEPLDDLTHERQLVEQLEGEVEDFKKHLPKSDEENKLEIIDRKMQEAQTLAAENILKEKELRKKKVLLEAKQKQMEVEIQELEIMEKDGTMRIDETDPSSTEAVDERRDDLNRSVEKMKQRKDDVMKRKEDLEEKKRQLEKDKQDFQENSKKQEEEIGALQNEFDRLAASKREIDECHIRLDELQSERTQLEIDITEDDDEIARLKRRLESQAIEMKKIELKNREAAKRRQALQEKLSALEERKKVLQERRDQLAKEVLECRGVKASLEAMRNDVEIREKALADFEEQLKESDQSPAIPDSEARSGDQQDSEYKSEQPYDDPASDV